jgi:hypothetical protein
MDRNRVSHWLHTPNIAEARILWGTAAGWGSLPRAAGSGPVLQFSTMARPRRLPSGTPAPGTRLLIASARGSCPLNLAGLSAPR